MKKLFSVFVMFVLVAGLSACRNIPTKIKITETSPVEESIAVDVNEDNDNNSKPQEVVTDQPIEKKDYITNTNAFNTYVGKTLDEIKQFASRFEKVNEGYMVESYEDENGAIALLVFFDEEGICNEVRYLFDKGTISSFGFYKPDSLINLVIGWMGLSDRDVVSEINMDDLQARLLSGNILCQTIPIETNKDIKYVSCREADTNLLEIYDFVYKSVHDRNISLVESRYSGNTLIATFLFENTGVENLQVGYLDFEARNGNYEKLELETYNCPGGISLAEHIIPDDKLRGNVCFKNAEITPITIYYKKDMFSTEVLTFTVE